MSPVHRRRALKILYAAICGLKNAEPWQFFDARDYAAIMEVLEG